MKRAIGILLIFFAIVVFFFRPYFFSGKLLFPSNLLMGYYTPWNVEKPVGWEGGVPFKGLGHDNLTIFYPMKTLLRKAIAEGSFPFWNPYNFAGAPLFGDGQSAVMYPFTLLYLLFPSLQDAFSVMVLLVPFLSMLFMYGMLRHFKLGTLASLFGAVTFAFSGFMSVWMEENPAVGQSAIWLPLLVWLLDLVITSPKRRWPVLFSIAVAVMLSSGFLQVCLYQLAFLAAYAFFRRKQLTRVIVSMVTGLLLVAPYLFTTWESYKLSPRDFVAVPEIRSIFLVQWSHILSLFNPDWLGNPGSYNYHGVGSYYDKILFIGVVGLFFALIGLFSKKNAQEKFFWWVAWITAFLGFSSPFTQWLFAQPIPILSSMLPSRIFYLTSFALSVIAARVFDRNKRLSLRPVASVYLAFIIIIEFFLIVYLTELAIPDYPLGYMAHSIRMMIVSSINVTDELFIIILRNVGVSVVLTGVAVLVYFFSARYKKVLFLILTIFSAWYFSSKSFYFGQREFVYPPQHVLTELQQIVGIDRVGYSNDLSRVKSSINVVYGFSTPEGLNPVFPFRFGQLVKAAGNDGKLTNDIPRISVDVDVYKRDPAMNRLINLLGMKYIVERKESGWYPDVYPRHKTVWEDPYFRIWENPDILPRAYFAPNIVVATDAQAILDAVYDPSIDLKNTAVVETPVTAGGTGTVNITSYRMNDLTLEVETTRGGFLVVGDNFAPGWHAEVDNEEVPLYRTNFTFRGVYVPIGKHTVFMYYLPKSFVIGLWAMGIAILTLIGYNIFYSQRRAV